MSSGQEFNNRSQGQRIRRTNERVEKAATVATDAAAQAAQAQRDIKVLQNRVGYLERKNQRQSR